MRYPQANVGIACGASDLLVVDCDHGLNSEEDFHAWRERNNLPLTYTVRTGRRTEYAVQMYFSGTMECNGKWELDGCGGEIRSKGGLVMAARNIHPDTGEVYQVIVDAPLAPRPATFEQSVKKAQRAAAKDDEGSITEIRNIRLTSIAGKLRNAGATPVPQLPAHA